MLKPLINSQLAIDALDHGFHRDRRLYLWVPSAEVGFIQGLLDAEDNLARIRTERHEPLRSRSLIVLMYSSTRQSEIDCWLEALRNQAKLAFEFLSEKS